MRGKKRKAQESEPAAEPESKKARTELFPPDMVYPMDAMMRAANRSEVFVNRKDEIANVAVINIRNEGLTQRLQMPLSAHTYGAGKSALVRHYTRRLQAKGMAKRVAAILFPDDLTEESVAWVRKVLGAFANAKEIIVPDSRLRVLTKTLAKKLQVALPAGADAKIEAINMAAATAADADDAKWMSIKTMVNDLLTPLANAIEEARKEKAVFLALDEIGELTPYGLRRVVRDWLLDQVKITESADGQPLQPMHVAMVGATTLADLEMVAGSTSGTYHQVFLEPLKAEHVAKLYAKFYRDLRSKLDAREQSYARRAVDHTPQPVDELSALGVFEVISELTAGVPRQVHRMLQGIMAAQHHFEEDDCDDAAAWLRNLADFVQRKFHGELQRFDDVPQHRAAFLDFVLLHLLRIPLCEADECFFKVMKHAAAALPVMLSALPGKPDEYAVSVAPIFCNLQTKDLSVVLKQYYTTSSKLFGRAFDPPRDKENRVFDLLLISCVLERAATGNVTARQVLHFLPPALLDELDLAQAVCTGCAPVQAHNVDPLRGMTASAQLTALARTLRYPQQTTAQKRYKAIRKVSAPFVMRTLPMSPCADVLIWLPGWGLLEFQVKCYPATNLSMKELCEEIGKSLCTTADKRGILILVVSNLDLNVKQLLGKESVCVLAPGAEVAVEGCKHQTTVPAGLRVVLMDQKSIEGWLNPPNQAKVA